MAPDSPATEPPQPAAPPPKPAPTINSSGGTPVKKVPSVSSPSSGGNLVLAPDHVASTDWREPAPPQIGALPELAPALKKAAKMSRVNGLATDEEDKGDRKGDEDLEVFVV